MDVNNSSIDKVNTEKKKQLENDDTIGSLLGEILNSVGAFGLYQWLLFLTMMPFGFFWAFGYFGQMFITATPQEHWCRVPELDGIDLVLRRSLSIPKISDSQYDGCNMFDANWTQVLETMRPPDIDTTVIPCQNGWEFLFEDIPYSTIVNEREWVCDNEHLVPLSQTIAFIGSIFGGILCGMLADGYGRLPALILANLLSLIGGIGTIFTTGFWDFAICRFLVGMSVDSCFMILYIIVLEYVGLKYRSLVANMSIALYFGGGCLVLPWIAVGLSNWKSLSLVMSVPMALVVISPLIVPESASWLISKRKISKTLDNLGKFERINRKQIPKELLDELIVAAKNTENEEESVLTILKTPSLAAMLLCLIATFMGVVMMFDSITRLSENLGFDFFLTFTISSATEVPSIALLVLLLDRFGRRWMLMGPMMISGVLSLVAAFIPRGAASVALAVTVRFFTNMAYGTVAQWTPELLPTSVRASGSSLVHASGFVAATITPFIIFSDKVWEGLSLIIVGVISIAISLLAVLLPETKGRRMPQTMDDMDDLTRNTVFATKKDANHIK